MRCLVTGATGFVGGHLMDALVAAHGAAAVVALVNPRRDGREVEVFDRLQRQGVRCLELDLHRLSPEDAARLPDFDVVYHLAAAAATEDPAADFSINDQGTLNLLRWIGPRWRGRRLIFTSTLACVDKPPSHRPITEETPCHPRTEYGRTKLVAEEHVRRGRSEWGYHDTILRLCTIVGEGVRTHGMFGVCPRLLARQALSSRLNWPGRSSFLTVGDLVRILAWAPNEVRTAGRTFVLSNGEDPTFDELLGQMASVLGVKRRRWIVPQTAWAVLGRMAWWGSGLSLLPARRRLDCWRAAHVIYSGIYADAARLNELLPLRYESVRHGLEQVYQRPSGAAPR